MSGCKKIKFSHRDKIYEYWKSSEITWWSKWQIVQRAEDTEKIEIDQFNRTRSIAISDDQQSVWCSVRRGPKCKIPFWSNSTSWSRFCWMDVMIWTSWRPPLKRKKMCLGQCWKTTWSIYTTTSSLRWSIRKSFSRQLRWRDTERAPQLKIFKTNVSR